MRRIAGEPLVCPSTALRVRALRPQLKRDPLGGCSALSLKLPDGLVTVVHLLEVSFKTDLVSKGGAHA